MRTHDIIKQYGHWSGETIELNSTGIEEYTDAIIQEAISHAMSFNANLMSLSDKEIRSHSLRIGDYIKDRMK